jgi:hypothetical protein
MKTGMWRIAGYLMDPATSWGLESSEDQTSEVRTDETFSSATREFSPRKTYLRLLFRPVFFPPQHFDATRMKDLTHTPFSLLKLESNELMIQPQPDLASLRKKTTIIPIRSPPACKRMMRCSEARVACMRLNGPGRHRRSPACMPRKPFLHAAAQ